MDMSMEQPAVDDRQVRQWALFLHLSLLAGFLIPLAGLVAPIIIWQLKKEEVIYFGASVLLIFVLIGIPLILLLCLVGVIFPIIGGIKASNGEVWKYPMSLTFFR
jgi:uncharacterized Tic20 family protein